MGRVSWKTNLLPKDFYNSLIKKQESFSKFSVNRSQKILKDFEDLDIAVPNGKTLQKFSINPSFLNSLAGDFVNTRSYTNHKNTSKKKR